MADYFADEPEFVNQTWDDPLLAIAAYWRVVHKVLFTQAARYPSWRLISHEALSADPIFTFQRLYRDLDLPWSGAIERRIRAMTEQPNAASNPRGVHQFTRNSQGIFSQRLHAIPRETRRKIFDIVQDVALPLYPRESFAID